MTQPEGPETKQQMWHGNEKCRNHVCLVHFCVRVPLIEYIMTCFCGMSPEAELAEIISTPKVNKGLQDGEAGFGQNQR